MPKIYLQFAKYVGYVVNSKMCQDDQYIEYFYNVLWIDARQALRCKAGRS